MHDAARFGYVSALEFAVERWANKNAINIDGDTPLDLLYKYRHAIPPSFVDQGWKTRAQLRHWGVFPLKGSPLNPNRAGLRR